MNELIARLVSEGVSAQLVADVAMALAHAQAAEKMVADRRAKDRARKAIPRNSEESAESAEIQPEPLSLSPNEINSNPHTHTPGEIPRTRKGYRIPEDWAPAKPLPLDCKTLTEFWPPGRIERELAGFVDYWISRTRDAAKSDWDRAWWNRIRDQHDRLMREHRNERGKPANDQRSSGRLLDRLRADDAAAGLA